MARTLQLVGARWPGSAVLLLAFVALWQVAGCVIPPQEIEVSHNHLPYIDWALTIPTDIEFSITKATGGVTTFSIEDAAIDVDGDTIETIWYWIAANGKPYREFGELSMTLDAVCQGVQDLRDSESISVEVVISDSPGALKWTNALDNPVDPGLDDEGNPLPLIKHVWVVTLEGDCP